MVTPQEVIMAKCAECGFLAARNRLTRTLDEAEDQFRQGGKPLVVDDKGGNQHPGWEHYPVCFHDAQDLTAKIKEAEANRQPSAASIHFALHEDRECHTFTPWHRGLTPRQHQERLERIADKESEAAWRRKELRTITIGNVVSACLGAAVGGLIVWLAR